METNSISHSKAGLLTRKQLTAGPEFGITLGNATDLDGFHVCFGAVLSGLDVLEAIAAVDRYTYSTKSGYTGKAKDEGSKIADQWFGGQREFYVNVAKGLGDQRAVDLRGKLLRRVMVKSAGRL